MKKIAAYIIALMMCIVFSGEFIAYGSILNYDGQAQVFIRPADKISPYSFPVYVNGKEIELSYWEEKDNFQYTFTYKAKGGNIEITPKTGYKITGVHLNEGFIEVWNSDTPATQEQIDSHTYDTTTYYDLTDPAIADNFYEKFPDGSVNYNGKIILSQDFLTKSPYAGWKKGEPMIFAVGKTPGPGGTVTMTVTTEFAVTNGVKIVTENEPIFTTYTYKGKMYIGHEQLEEAINLDISRHSLTPGYTVEIAIPSNFIKGARIYSWPPKPSESAHLTVSSQRISFILLPDCQMVLTLVYDGPSKGQIAYSKTLPLNPDVPPDNDAGSNGVVEDQAFFDTFVNTCQVSLATPGTDAKPQTFHDFENCNNYLKTIPSDTEVSLTYDFKDDYYIKSASPGTVTNNGKTLNVRLLGPTAVMTPGNGSTDPQGEWTGTIVKGPNGEPEYEDGVPHYDIATMGWKQDYTEGDTLSIQFSMATKKPQLAIDDFTAGKAFGDDSRGHVLTAYISNSSLLDEGVLSGAKIKLSGTCEYTDNPHNEMNKTLPETEYKLGSDISGGTYCGYLFSPANDEGMKYHYKYRVTAVLIMPDGTQTTVSDTVEFGGEGANDQ